MKNVFAEAPPISDKDCFYIVERHKDKFTYPLHSHREYELNFISNGAGVRRIVGDSVETIGQYDLVLIAGDQLEHVWEQGNCNSTDIREITIQFSPTLFDTGLLSKGQFDSISKMLQHARHGLCFSQDAIMKVYSMLDTVSSETDSFEQMLDCLKILHELSRFEGRVLATSTFSKVPRHHEYDRIERIQHYVHDHYSEPVTLQQIADMISMSPSACSRYFRTHTGRTLSEYVVDVRLGTAARALVDTNETISSICYKCGFNNLSNFNRVFKARRGMTPGDFRRLYMKKKVII